MPYVLTYQSSLILCKSSSSLSEYIGNTFCAAHDRAICSACFHEHPTLLAQHKDTDTDTDTDTHAHV